MTTDEQMAERDEANKSEPELPAHPEDFEYAVLFRSHDYKRTKWAIVPEGQSLDFDEGGGASRRWLWPYLGDDWHLFAFVSLRAPHNRGGVTVKPLEWREDNSRPQSPDFEDIATQWAGTALGWQWATIIVFTDRSVTLQLSDRHMACFSVPEAKASAQFDYEQRIISALALPAREPPTAFELAYAEYEGVPAKEFAETVARQGKELKANAALIEQLEMKAAKYAADGRRIEDSRDETRADLEAAEATISRQSAQIDKARKALKPFAKAAKEAQQDAEEDCLTDYPKITGLMRSWAANQVLWSDFVYAALTLKELESSNGK